MYARRYLSFLAIAACALVTAGSPLSTKCSSFAKSASLSAYKTSFLNATYYAKGALNDAGVLNKVSFCEVYASVSYGSNDTLVFALWLPDKQYSSRFMAVGNGGQAGVVNYADMMVELNNGLGFAVAGGNAGHLATDNDAGVPLGLGAPGAYQPYLHDKDQMEAWLHNAISLLTPASKALIKAFYGSKAKYSYFRGCSAGGAQGFSLAQFHPDLFDGIIAGCSVNGFSHNLLSFLWGQQHTNTPETTLPDSVLDFIQASVIKKCDKIDGVADNLIENPLACPFDISTLACKAGVSAANDICLTPAQLAAVKAIYKGPIRSDSPKTTIFPGLSLGSEAGWSLPQVSGALSNAFAIPILQNTVYDDLSYNASTFNWGSDVDVVDARAGTLINSTKTNFSYFRKTGKKMIVWAGWADPNIPPMWSLKHVEAITNDTLGHGTTIAENDFIKLVMVPGGGHCGANIAKYPYVPATYEFSPAIVEWVEKGRQPIEGVKSWGPTNGDDRTRRLCTWPRVAALKKGGDVDDWESYTCK